MSSASGAEAVTPTFTAHDLLNRPGLYAQRSHSAWRAPCSGPAREQVAGSVHAWAAAGATHVAINTARSGPTTAAEHIDALSRVAKVLGLRPGD